jgi:hypothetical protein
MVNKEQVRLLLLRKREYEDEVIDGSEGCELDSPSLLFTSTSK